MDIIINSIRHRTNYSILVFFIIPLILLIPQTSFAQDQQLFENKEDAVINPQRTMYTFIHWQLEGHEKYDLAIIPFATATDLTKEEKKDYAYQLKQVFDAKGFIVDYDTIPSDVDYEDPISGLHRYTPFPELPEIYLAKTDSGWYFAQKSILDIPRIHDQTISSLVRRLVADLPDWTQEKFIGLHLWQHVALFIWILLSLILAKIFRHFLENYIKRLTEKTKTDWDDNLLKEIESPLNYLFIAIFLTITQSQLLLPVEISAFFHKILGFSRDIIILWLVYRLVNVLCDYLTSLTEKTENPLDDQLIPLIRKSLKVFTVLVGVIFILQNNGVQVTAFITGLGIGGLAFALAAKDTLANLFGSVTIFLDKPFRMGDWIVAGSSEGVVEEIGFRSTRIRTFYNSQISVPNSIMANTEIDNYGRRKYRRLSTTFGIEYGTPPAKIEAFVEGIKAIVKANEKIRQDYFEVHFNKLGAHSLDILVYIFFNVPSWSEELQQRHNFLLQCVRLAKDLGVEFAFPTQTIHIASQAKAKEMEEPHTDTDEALLVQRLLEYSKEGQKHLKDGVELHKDGETINFKA